MNNRKGFSLIELMVALAIITAASTVIVGINMHVYSQVNSNSAIQTETLLSGLTSVLSDPILCTQNLDRTRLFNPIMANSNSQTNGYQIAVKMPDGTLIDGHNPGVLNKYSLKLNNLTFRTKGSAKPLEGVKDPNVGGVSSVYSGDVYVSVSPLQPGNSTSGGTNEQMVATIMLTVDSTNKIVRCYSPDPCKGIGGSFNEQNKPSCSVCPAGETWVGNNVQTGNPICLPECPPDQIMVSDGTGFGAKCMAAHSVDCVVDRAVLTTAFGDCCTEQGYSSMGISHCGDQLQAVANSTGTGKWSCTGDSAYYPALVGHSCGDTSVKQFYGCTTLGQDNCRASCACAM